MPPPQHPFLSILIPVLLALSAVGAQGATLKEDEVVSDLATRFRWRDPYNWQPVLERDIAVPALPDGHKKFQFYIQDENGQLVQEWFTLQEIQDLLIRFGPIFRHEGEAAHPSTDSPEDSIHQVIASVQQVISEEVAQTQRLPVSPLPSRPSSSPPSDSLLSQAVEESIDIPDGILQNLKNHPYFMTSWVTLPTTQPEETTTNPWLLEGEEHSEDVEEVIEALEVNQGVTEAATATLPEVFDVQGEAVTENAITDVAADEFIVTEDASAADVTTDSVDLNAISDSGETKSDSQTVAPTGVEDTTVSGMPGRGSESTVADYETTTPPATQRPLFDRWNSRYPAWTAFPARDTPTTVAIPSYDLEPVDDYNSSPVGLSGVEKPADDEVKVEFGFTTWNYPGEHDEAMDGMSTTTEHENLREDSTTMQPENGSQERPTQDILLAAENENSQPRSTTPVDTMDATTINGVTITPTDQSLVNKIVVSMNTMESDFEQTTRTVPSEVEKEPSVSVTTPSPTTIAPEKPQGTTSPSEIPIDNLHVEMDSATEYYPWSAEDNDPYFPLMSDPLLSDGAMTLMDLFKHQGDTSNYFGEAPHYDFPVFEDKPSQSSEDLTSDKEGIAASMEEQDSTTEFSIIQDLTTNSAQDATLQETPSVDLSAQDMPNQHSSMENLEILDQNTQSLITDGPSTQSPETQSPSTEGPQGEYPTTKDVSSQSLAIKASTSLPPTTNPVVEAMTTQSPAVQELTSQNPSSPETTELPLDTQTTTSQAPLLDPVTTPVPISPASVSQEPELPETNKGAAEPTATTPEPSENPAEEALPTTRVVLPTLPTTDRPTSTEESKQPAIRPSYDYYYDTFGSSNILPPAPSSNEERIDLGALERTGGQTDDYYYDDYYPSAVYLDNVSEDYYDYTTNATQPVAALNDTDLDFPGPNATSPYHDHHHGEHHGEHHHGSHHHPQSQSGPPAKLLEAPPNNPGLEASVEGLDADVRKFVDVMNDVAFKVYKRAARQYKRKNFVMSPLSLISTLSMLLLGARGTSSAALSDLLLTDQFYTFNPHLILKNVTQVLLENDGAHDVVFLNQFLVEKPKNPYSLDFFARTIKYFYDASVSQVEPSDFDSHVRDRVNEMVRNVTFGAVGDFLLQDEPLYLTPPLSAVSTNFFHGRWNHPVTQDDLFDMDFLQFPTAERRLVRTVGLSKKMTINAGYSSAADVTTAEIPFYSRLGELSLILVMPGKQKDFVANGLAQLEASLSPVKWSQILRSMLPNTVQFQMPVFRHRAFHNFSDILQDVGLGELFQADKADFSGINNVKGLRLSDVVQLTEFQSCQIEEPLKDGATSSRRVRRKAQGADFDETGPTAYYRKTYIYGLPMFEYMRREEGEEEEEEQDLDTEYAAAESFQTAKSSQSPFVASLRTEAPSASPDLTSSKAQWSNADGDDLSGLQAESLLRQDLLDYYGPLLSAPDENRVNRMGIPHARKPAGGGTYYRQDDAGTLAFDRAFLYVVRHNPTGLLLFMGRYLDPAAN